jgi:branched-chain amino acid aminotransferase
VNEQIVPEEKASVGLTDLGLVRGYGVFDFLRTYQGKPFLIDEHLQRLKRSADTLNLGMPKSIEEIRAIIEELIKRNKFKESNAKIVITGGPETDDADKLFPTLYILISELKRTPGRIYSEGAKVITYRHRRELPEAKTTNYATAFMLKKWQARENAFEILYTHNNKVLEATTSNFFILKGRKLITPDKDILFGITRNLVIELSGNHFDVEERDVGIEDLEEASEAFITATNKEVVPVVRIDDKIIGNGEVGTGTERIMRTFKDYAEKRS